MKFKFRKENLVFKNSAKTSRGILLNRPTAFLELEDEKEQLVARGEIAPIEGLSQENWSEVEQEIQRLKTENNPLTWSSNCSSVQFAIDCIHAQLNSKQVNFPFAKAENQFNILLNGLVWMNDISTMHKECDALIESGFTAVKFKIGSLSWQNELNFLHAIRTKYPEIEIRLDANGAFEENALGKLKELSEFGIHSIEQPIARGDWQSMAQLCVNSPIPIALDEELIGWNEDMLSYFERNGLPQYLVVKPSLHGGMKKCELLSKWVELNNINFWITSYLESNIGLNHLANWVCSNNWNFRHGLGTGALFVENFEERWKVVNGFLIPLKNDS